MMLPATCVLLPTRWDTEHILAISRRNDTTQWGIPGGKVDPGESNIHAAMREIKEEGLVVREFHLRELCNLLASPFAPYNQNVLAAWRTFKMR